MIDLSTKYLGLTLKNPLLIGSSGLTSSADSILEMVEMGAAGVVLKSVFEEEIMLEHEKTLKDQLGHQQSNLEFLDYLDYQIKQDALERTRKVIEEVKKGCDVPVIASINCYSVGEWFSYARLLQEAGADALELNIYRIPSKIGLEANDILNEYYEIVGRVKEHVTIPVSVKISPYFTDLGNVVSKFDMLGVNGMVFFNRYYAPDFNLESNSISSGSLYTNPGDYTWALRWIAMLNEQVTCNLCASGGIHSADSLFKLLLAGADAAQVVSVIYKNGPGYIRDLLSGLEKWMESKGLNNIAQVHAFGGNMLQNQGEIFERVQFMKYFGGYKP